MNSSIAVTGVAVVKFLFIFGSDGNNRLGFHDECGQ